MKMPNFVYRMVRNATTGNNILVLMLCIKATAYYFREEFFAEVPSEVQNEILVVDFLQAKPW